ncbi:hypothetical protein D5F01_LYC00783 [Larimichthys crocea]|uniref:Uncharacterized protein n=1 Tax=Larimichthys crocea TaxID=215358 RepID=A0A6G0JAK8_LARCR|nr:hypothetical protein D5F01_LYC00783 [Larimichthys crocea]
MWGPSEGPSAPTPREDELVPSRVSSAAWVSSVRPGAERRAVRRKAKNKKNKEEVVKEEEEEEENMEERRAVSPFVCFYSAIVPAAASTSTLTKLHTQWRSGAAAEEEEEEEEEAAERRCVTEESESRQRQPPLTLLPVTNFKIKADFRGGLLRSWSYAPKWPRKQKKFLEAECSSSQPWWFYSFRQLGDRAEKVVA